MNKVVLNRLLRKLVSWGYRSSLFTGIKPIVKSVLLEGTIPLSSIVKNKCFGVFKDHAGNTFSLIEGLRDAVKPGWQWICKPRENEIPSAVTLQQTVQEADRTIRKMLSFLENFDFRISGKAVLEVGCYDGSKTCALLSAGASKVIGSDIAEYYLSDTGDEMSASSLIGEQREYLRKLRMAVTRAAFNENSASETMHEIEFVEDNISASSLPSECFDFVCSWEVLEHIGEPAKLFREIYRILRPGGIAFHEYNPFFSINGGHSQCTLDFLWGHTMLNDEDFQRYLQEFRPKERRISFNTFRQGLNRLTLDDLRRYLRESGVELLAFIPWHERLHLELLTPEIMRIARMHYPSLTVEDFISPFVWIVYMKPAIKNG